MPVISLSPFSEEQYHAFFREYVPDPLMTSTPFIYNYEQISRSFQYNYGGFQKGYAHFGIFLDQIPVGSFQLKRMDFDKGTAEFGIILQNDRYKNKGIGTQAIIAGMEIARSDYGIHTLYGETMSRNYRMKRVFEKLGFKLVEMVPNAYQLPDGCFEDRLVWVKNME